MQKKGYVYIMSNIARTVLYTGVTSNLPIRISQHKTHQGSAFTRKHNCIHLVYYEEHNDIRDAIAREKAIKNWKREWKDELITSINPNNIDLSSDW